MSLPPPPLPKRRPISVGSSGPEAAHDSALITPSVTTASAGDELSLSLPPTDTVIPPTQHTPILVVTPAPSSVSGVMNGSYPSEQALPHSIKLESPNARMAQSHQNAQSARNKEEVSFQFDRQVQEIRRRRTVPKKAPRPDRDDFTRVESETGKRILDFRLYLLAYFTYFVESLARDDKIQKTGPLQWSKIKALLSRLYDTSSPAQSLGLYVEHVVYWRNPVLTGAWCTLYFLLWWYRLWLPGCISLLVLKMLSNRYGFLENFERIPQMPTVSSHSDQSDLNKRKDPWRSTKMHSQLRELIHSKDLTDWISQMTKIWGPYGQALLEENINYLERLKNLVRWENPDQTWRVVALLMFYVFISTFFQYMVVPAVGFFIGVEFFFLLPLQKSYPRLSHVFSPLEWILWGVPTNAELVVELMTRQQENEELRQHTPLPNAESRHHHGRIPSSSMTSKNSATTNAMVGASTEVSFAAAGQSSMEGNKRSEHGQDLTQGYTDEKYNDDEDTVKKDSVSFMAGLSPASKIKYEYQKRTRGVRSSSGASLGSMDMMHGAEEPHERSEFHCLLRGKPGKLVIDEETLLFRSSKLLGREIELQIHWEDIDTIKKSKSMNLGIWSMPGLDVTDVDGRVIAFQNVVHRDEAFRKLVVSSGKKWTHVT